MEERKGGEEERGGGGGGGKTWEDMNDGECYSSSTADGLSKEEKKKEQGQRVGGRKQA